MLSLIRTSTMVSAGTRSPRPDGDGRHESVGVRRRTRAQRVADVARDPLGRRRRRGGRRRSASTSRPERLAARPQVRVLEAALVGVQRVGERPERALGGGRLGGVGERDGARVLGLQREVAERDARAGLAQARRGRRRSAGRRSPRRRARAVRRAGPRTWSSARRPGTGALRRSVIRREPTDVASGPMHVHVLQREQRLQRPPEARLPVLRRRGATSRRSRRRCCASGSSRRRRSRCAWARSSSTRCASAGCRSAGTR